MLNSYVQFVRIPRQELAFQEYLISTSFDVLTEYQILHLQAIIHPPCLSSILYTYTYFYEIATKVPFHQSFLTYNMYVVIFLTIIYGYEKHKFLC
jgi:hypothetical protein